MPGLAALGTEIPFERYTVALGKANIVREGADLTLATLSTMVEKSLAAAEIPAGEGIGVEVVDLRTVVPLDDTTVTESVGKTGRLLVVDEDYLSFGLSGEPVARAIENLGPSAVKSVARVANPDIPIPAALSLERVVIPNVDRIASVARSVVDGGVRTLIDIKFPTSSWK